MKPAPTFEEIVRMRIVHRVPGTDRVLVDRGRPYKTVSGGALLADVYRPADTAAPCPAVVLIHGGPVPAGRTPKDMGCFVSWGETLAASGLAAVTFNRLIRAPLGRHAAPAEADGTGTGSLVCK